MDTLHYSRSSGNTNKKKSQQHHQFHQQNLSSRDVFYVMRQVKMSLAKRNNIRVDGYPFFNKAMDDSFLCFLLEQLDLKHIKIKYSRRSKENNNQRSIIVAFYTYHDKMTVLRQCKKLRSLPNFNNIYINPDFTKLEAKHNYELRVRQKKENSLLPFVNENTLLRYGIYENNQNGKFRYYWGIRNECLVRVFIGKE